MEIIASLGTFLAIVLAALLIAWGAECGQFYVSQGLALAVLAWVQTLPEFSVEAVIALTAAHDPSKTHLVTANFTGSLRLFVGLGWPMVYFVAVFFGKKRGAQKGLWAIQLEDEQAIAVMTLLPALAYFVWIYCKGTLNVFDSGVLAAIYFFYLYLLSKTPPEEREEMEDLSVVPRAVMRLPKNSSIAVIFILFISGGLLLWFMAHPFLDSMLALAVSLGVSEFVFVQWLAPFLSEFPEQLSAFRWARSGKKAPMALANFVSSSINQWTILVATVPIIYSIGLGRIGFIAFDEYQKVEILLTIVQSYLGFLFLVSMDFAFKEALGLFVLWMAQFLVPSIREEIIWVYGGWAVVETARIWIHFKERNAFHVFRMLMKEHFPKRV